MASRCSGKFLDFGLQLVLRGDVLRLSSPLQGYDVLATSRSPEPHAALLPYKWQKRPGHVRFERIDLNQDLDALDRLLKRGAADARRQFRRAEHGR